MLRSTVLEPLAVDAVAGDLHEHGYYAGLWLPPRLVAELRRYAEENKCERAPNEAERFLIRDVRDGRSPLGNPVAVADLDPHGCPAVALIAGDACLVHAVRSYLGYSPALVAARLYWSPMSSLSDDERRWNGQTVDYHYDIERSNSVYVYFYLGDTDRHGGAHVIVAGSHKSKPWRMKFASTRQPEQAVLSQYGADKVVVLEGKAGFGFLEDPACFHKVLPPLKTNRLMLQLRYS